MTMTSDATDLRRLADAVQRLDLDQPFRVAHDGTVTDAPDGDRRYWAPEVTHDPTADVVIHSDAGDRPGWGWHTLTDALSRQWGYRGAVMHPSEYVGPAIADRVMYYADTAREDGEAATFVMVEVTDPDGDDDGDPIGWVVLYRTDPDA